jgi:uncharacterized protein (DUF2336 family)
MASKSPLSMNLLTELETTLTHGTVARRVETLRRVTDLFINHAVDYTDEQIAIFDDVFECLLGHMEASAKILLAERLGPIGTAPPRVVRTLAFDDLVEVASPLLSQSERLDDDALIANASTKSQGHLMAISTRKTLNGSVTEVLVKRGNDDVVKSTVNNPGAAFTDSGYTTLVARAAGNDEIATCVGLRPSIPRHHYLKLVAKASASVRAKLEAGNPKHAADVSLILQEVARQARSAPSAMNEQAAISHGLVRSLFEDGRLDENEVMKFAEAGQFNEANAAIACLANVTVDLAETIMVESRSEGVFILSKVANFSWKTVKAIINMREQLSGARLSDNASDRDTYELLRPSSAQQVLRFHRMQKATFASPVL